MSEHADRTAPTQAATRNGSGNPGDDECSLCGLPAGRSQFEYTADGVLYRFCCPGCLYVFQVLYNSPEGPPEDFRESELYKACLASGLIAAGPEKPAAKGKRERPESSPAPEAEEDERLSQELHIRIGGMWCTACSWLIEETLRNTGGVLDVRVAFLSDLALVKYLPHRVSPLRIMDSIAELGYRASSFEDRSLESQEQKDLFLRLGISFILMMNIMMISFALYFGFMEEFGAEAAGMFSYPLWVLATPVVFYGGYPILRRAFFGLAHRSVSMDTLIAVGVLSAYIYSVIMLFSGSIHLYFDTAAMLVTLVLLGRYIEARARKKVSGGIEELCRMANGKVRLTSGDRERWVSAESLRTGDEFFALSGERVPVDARVVSGRATIDESIVTGESRPVGKTAGDDLTGGSLLLGGELRLAAVHVGPDGFLNRMVALMREAVTNKAPAELFADRVTRKLVPAVLLLAAGTALVLLLRGSSGEEAMIRALSVLVITCPCALGIAIPLAKVTAVGVGRTHGILVRDPAALERIGKLDTLLFDKTGTLTEGNFSLRSLMPPEVLREIASVEAHSEHFLAKAILDKARETLPVFEKATDFEEFPGMGVKGVIEGRELAVGNRRFMAARGLDLSPELDRAARSLEEEGATIVFFGREGKTRGILEFGDTIRAGAKDLVTTLRGRGITLWLVSGDSHETTAAVAQELGIEHRTGQACPSDKVELVRRLQGEGHSVGMIGDGINDAAALARADVGFAAGNGQNITREASDITLLTDDPVGVLRAFELAALTTRTVRTNLYFAFLYNLLAVPLAVAGWLNPLWAAFAMFAGSLTVIGNTSRISRAFPPAQTPKT